MFSMSLSAHYPPNAADGKHQTERKRRYIECVKNDACHVLPPEGCWLAESWLAG